MTALALWFISETKLDWAREYGRDPQLARQLEVEILPNLSVANVRELLRGGLATEPVFVGGSHRLGGQTLVSSSLLHS
ncbi:hypothetical protein M1O56_03685 [Dehalococcoidia bacterium]|nr:hypothetical protein [Dehalococcoidia bacterium]MCL0078749.1 hypothetical protein [Dehalococcoidia bacterium]